MSVLCFDWQPAGQITFGLSLAFMFASLALALQEIQMSGGALDLLLKDVKCREH